ncbi:MAG: GntR family transcriptional regulator [Breznakia sp.]
MNFDANLPIYVQIMNDFKNNIVSNNFVLGSKVKSVRELAIDYGVNPNTVQRALSELEREGLLYSERTVGRYVTQDEALVKELKVKEAGFIVATFIDNMQNLGMDEDTLLSLLKKGLKKKT